MTKLKSVLASKYFVYVLFSLAIIYMYGNIRTNTIKSNHNLTDTSIRGTIQRVNFSDDKVTLVIDDVMINYYIKPSEKMSLKIGDKILAQGSLSYPSGQENFYLFNYQNYLRSKGIYYVMQASKIELISKTTSLRYKIKDSINSHINQRKNREYLKAFIVGDNSFLDDTIKKSYQENGISHLFAVSGMHVTLLTAIIYFIFHKLLKKDMVINIITIIFLLFYMDLTNYTPSIVRAVMLFILCLLNKHLKLNIKTDYLLLYIFSVNIIINPYLVYNNGFLFSYIVSYSLIRFGFIINMYNKYFIKVLITSLISFLSSLPLVINSYFSINLLTPFLNIIFVPLVSFVIFPLALLYFFFPWLNGPFSFMIKLMENLSLLARRISLLITLAHLPFWAIIVYYIIILFILWQLGKRKYWSLVLLLILVFLHYHFSYFNNRVIINVINVGQGDTLLIRLPHNKGNILIDCANKVSMKGDYNISESIVIPSLKAFGVHKLDYVILSHGDYDHIGGMDYLMHNFKIDNVVFNSDNYNFLETNLKNYLDQKNIKYYQGLEKIKLDRYNFIFLNTKLYDNENDNSNVIYFKVADYSFLFMGDASVSKEEDLLKKYSLKNITFLKVGHHGSNTSSTSTFIDSINPQYSLISVGENNRYNHPHQDVLKRLEKSSIYRTDIDGGIKIVLRKKQIQIFTSIS